MLHMGHSLHNMGDALPSMGSLHIKAMPQLGILLALLVPTLLQATHQQVILVYLLDMPQGLMEMDMAVWGQCSLVELPLPLPHVVAHHLSRGSYGFYAHAAHTTHGKFKHGKFGGLAWRFQEVGM